MGEAEGLGGGVRARKDPTTGPAPASAPATGRDDPAPDAPDAGAQGAAHGSGSRPRRPHASWGHGDTLARKGEKRRNQGTEHDRHDVRNTQDRRPGQGGRRAAGPLDAPSSDPGAAGARGTGRGCPHRAAETAAAAGSGTGGRRPGSREETAAPGAPTGPLLPAGGP